MGYKLFRDGRCKICGRHATFFCDYSGKFYCKEHMKLKNDKGSMNSYRFGIDAKKEQVRHQVYR